jgi:superfamily II DNA/RNA helicase
MEKTFASIGVPEHVVRTLAKKGITEPFPVQLATIPDGLEGRDVAGKAPTGSGKTLAFGIPIVARVGKATKRSPRALILAPTRELAEQIKEEIFPLARAMGRDIHAVYGGVPYGGQRTALNRGVDILVATPGRLEDLIEQRLVNLGAVDMIVVDEADRMADMGFLPAVKRILDQTAPQKQTLLFSATLDGDVAVLVRDYQKNPVRHETGTVDSGALDARHHFWNVEHHDRIQHTADVISHSGRSIVFTRTRHGADRLSKQLAAAGVRAVAMHGGRSQNQRQRALKDFSNGRVQALIATDVAARGIHIEAVETVIHYDPAADHKDYLHRSGRTARAGATGTVVSLVTRDKKNSVLKLQRQLDLKVPFGDPRVSDLGAGGHHMGNSPRVLNDDRKSQGGDRKEQGDRARPRSRNGGGGADRQRDSHDRPAPSVFVGNLPWTATDSELRDLFAGHGNVRNATVITDRRSGRSKGFGFVEMSHVDARGAIDALKGSTMGGRSLNVRFAEPRASNRS